MMAANTHIDRTRLASRLVVAASVVYALIAGACLPHRLPLADALQVFFAGAIPGLVATLLFWLVRPDAFDARRRRTLIAVILAGAASVALLPMLLPAL